MLATVRARTPLLWTGLVVVLCLVFAWLSLANVSGATVRDDGSWCDTEYVRGWWSLAPTLLVFPIYFIARLSWLLLLGALTVSGAVVFYIAYMGVTRIEDAGWGDGLERLAYVLAAFQLVLFVAAGAIGALRRRRPSL